MSGRERQRFLRRGREVEDVFVEQREQLGTRSRVEGIKVHLFARDFVSPLGRAADQERPTRSTTAS